MYIWCALVAAGAAELPIKVSCIVSLLILKGRYYVLFEFSTI